MSRYFFPKWTNRVPGPLFFGQFVVLGLLVAGFWYYGTDKFFSVGYQPKQPVEYSHKLHAGDLGMDCRYCHYSVERSSFSAVPPTQVCMNCHSKVRTDSALLAPVRESFANDTPIPWVRVHHLPDYVYFDHSAHLNGGIGCSTCHGRVDQMARITQKEPLTMGWCLDCHRNPAPNIRKASELTDMTWKSNPEATALIAPNGRTVNPPTNCSGCHR